MIEIIPAIDIINGKCVRLEQGDYGKKQVYHDDPLVMAEMFQNAGVKRLHLVDLDGAAQGRVVNLEVLKRIAGQTGLIIDFGGGIKNHADVQAVFEAGASMLTAGSIAVKEPETVKEWLRQYGPEKIILGADVKDGYIAISGWKESTPLELFDFIRTYSIRGIRRLICTDIGKDGMLQGPSTSLYQELVFAFPDLEIIASGGVTEISDIDDLNRIGVHGVIIGKALYEGTIPLDQLERYL